MPLPAVVAGAAALFSIGKGVYDSIKQGEHNAKMAKILAAKKAPAAAPVVQAPASRGAPTGAPPPLTGAPTGAPVGAGMAPMPVQSPPTEVNMTPVPPVMAPMVGPSGPNPMLGMAGANPGPIGMAPPPNPLAQDPTKPKNPWEMYVPQGGVMG